MIDDLDQALRKLFIRELPIKNGEVDIAFDQPRREWSSRLSRPTLNFYIYDLHENNKLRRSKQWRTEYNDDGTATQRRPPVRMDVHYMITAWAADPGDEHRLLARTLLVLLQLPFLPDDVLPERLQNQPAPIPLEIAQPDALVNATDIWSVLDNEMRPAVACTITVALDPYMPVTEPLVRTRELLTGQVAPPLFGQPGAGAGRDSFWAVGGTLRSEQPLENAYLTLVERGLRVAVQPEGTFTIGQLRAGDYTVEITAKGREPRRYKISVPSESYDFET